MRWVHKLGLIPFKPNREYPMTDRYFSRAARSCRVSLADDDWRGSIVVKKGVLQARRLRFLLSIKLTPTVRICLLGEMSGIFIK